MTSSPLKYLCIICLACLCGTSLAAHEVKDTLAYAKGSAKKEHRQDIGFSAADYVLQKRFRPANERFVSDRFVDNTFISVTGHAQQLLPVNGNTFAMQYSVGGNIGMWFNEYNALRLGASAGTLSRNVDNNRLFNMGVEADYMFNLTSYLGGYRRSRLCELSAVAGAGYMFSYDDGEFRGYGNFHAGLNVAVEVGKDIDLFFEPLAYLYGNGIVMLPDMNWKNYNLSPGLKVGLTYVVQPKEYKRPKINYFEDAFLSLGFGGQFQHADAVYNTVGLRNAVKAHYMLSFGKMYRDGFGFRTSFMHSRNLSGETEEARFVGFRLEAMYDLMSLKSGLRDDFPFSASLLFGPEAGIIRKIDAPQSFRTPYVGATGGFQAKLRFARAMSVFVEPRFSAVLYSHENGLSPDSPEKRANYADLLFNGNVGLELDMDSKIVRGRNWSGADYSDPRFTRRISDDQFVADRFWDNTFISLTGETMALLPVDGKTFSPQYAVGGNVGKWINYIHAIRLGASAGYFVRNSISDRVLTAGVEADYLYNITAHHWGYSRDRFCHLSAVAGLGYRLSFTDATNRDYVNLHFGANLAFNVGKDVDIFVEPLLYVQGDDMIYRTKAESSLAGNFDIRHFMLSPAMKVGMTYNVLPVDHKRPAVNYLEDSFVSLGVGGQFQVYGDVFNEIGLFNSIRPHYMLSLGKIYTDDGFGFRSSFTWSSDLWDRNGEGGDLKAGYFGARVEMMYNLMKLNKGLRDDFPFSAYILAGPEAGILKKQGDAENNIRAVRDVYVGLTGGLQAKYKVARATSLFVEPRFSFLTYSEGNPAKGDYKEKRSNLSDLLLNCNLGLELDLGDVVYDLRRAHMNMMQSIAERRAYQEQIAAAQRAAAEKAAAQAALEQAVSGKTTPGQIGPGQTVPVYMDTRTHLDRYAYVPRDFVSERFWDNTFISLTGEAMQLFANNGSTYSTQYAVGGNIGKWINSTNAIRLGASMGTFVKNLDHARMYNIGVEADHMYNITNGLFGYDLERFCNWSTVAGLGYRISRYKGSFKDYVNLHLGMNFAFKVGQDIDLFAEPLLYFIGDDLIHKNTAGSSFAYNFDPRHFICAPALKVGATCMIQPKDKKRPGVNYFEDSFISFGVGGQFQAYGDVFSEVGLLKSMRPHYMLSIGRIYADGFGFRSTLTTSSDIWKRGAEGQDLEGKYYGGRVELMYDLMNLKNDIKEDHRFMLSALVGPEAGILKKQDNIGRNVSDVYVGLTGGLQAKYRFAKSASIFVEPRFSYLLYSEGNPNGYEERRSNLTDLLMNCNLGLEFALGGGEDGKRRYENLYPSYGESDGRRSRGFINERFFDNTFISLTGEALQMFPNNGSTYATQYAVGGNIGKWVNRANAIRLGASVGTFVKNSESVRLYNMGVEADWMYSLTNGIFGYDAERFCNWSTVAGLGYRLSHYKSSYKDYINLHLGMNFSFKVGRDIDLFAEPLLYFMGDDVIYKNAGASSFVYNFDPRNYICAPALKVGATCLIQPKDNKRTGVNYFEDTFVSLAAGVQFEHSGLVLNGIGMMKSLRPHYMLSLGRLYSRGFGFRGSLTHSNDIWRTRPEDGKLLMAAYNAARFELSYDFLTPVKAVRKDLPVSLSVFMGPEAGFVKKEDIMRTYRQVYIGATGGVQAKFDVTDHFSVFLEPRASALQYSGASGKGQRANYKDVLFSCNLGVEFSL